MERGKNLEEKMKKITRVIIAALLVINFVFGVITLFADSDGGTWIWYLTKGWKDQEGDVWCPHPNATVNCYDGHYYLD